MCRTLRTLILSTLFLMSEAGASVDRLAVLGGLSQSLLDDSNSFIFPATLSEWPRFEVELFDDWAGVAYPLSPQHTLGLFFNRPTPELATFNETISQNGSDLFRTLSPNPWLDLAYSYTPKPGLSLGTSVALAYDRNAQGPRTASVVNSDFRLGMRVGPTRGPALDLTLGILFHQLQDQTLEEITPTEDARAGMNMDIRYRWPLNSRLTLLPYIGLISDIFALGPDEKLQTSVRFGTGLHLTPTRGVLLIAALDTRYEQTRYSISRQQVREDKSLWLPTWILGGEVQVGSMIFRLGTRHETWLMDHEQLHSNQWVQSSSFTTNFSTHLGLGLEFGNLLLDGLLERDFLRDGPHILGGSRHGGGILSHLSLTYRFNQPSE